jgi:hypothetical protein
LTPIPAAAMAPICALAAQPVRSAGMIAPQLLG